MERVTQMILPLEGTHLVFLLPIHQTSNQISKAYQSVQLGPVRRTARCYYHVIIRFRHRIPLKSLSVGIISNSRGGKVHTIYVENQPVSSSVS